MTWADLNERQQQYMQAIYETDQEQEVDERGAWQRGGTPRPASIWRWMEYGVFDGVGSALYTKLYLRKLIDEGTGSTFNALESRGFIECKYTYKRRDGGRETFERFLMLRITKAGRKLVRSATGAQREKALPSGTLREWHWRAMAEAWKARPDGLKSETSGTWARIGWNTWLRLREYKAGSLIEEFIVRKPGEYWQYRYWCCIRLTSFGEQYYRENWQRYRELYPEVDAPAPD